MYHINPRNLEEARHAVTMFELEVDDDDSLDEHMHVLREFEVRGGGDTWRKLRDNASWIKNAFTGTIVDQAECIEERMALRKKYPGRWKETTEGKNHQQRCKALYLTLDSTLPWFFKNTYAIIETLVKYTGYAAALQGSAGILTVILEYIYCITDGDWSKARCHERIFLTDDIRDILQSFSSSGKSRVTVMEITCAVINEAFSYERAIDNFDYIVQFFINMYNAYFSGGNETASKLWEATQQNREKIQRDKDEKLKKEKGDKMSIADVYRMMPNMGPCSIRSFAELVEENDKRVAIEEKNYSEWWQSKGRPFIEDVLQDPQNKPGFTPAEMGFTPA